MIQPQTQKSTKSDQCVKKLTLRWTLASLVTVLVGANDIPTADASDPVRRNAQEMEIVTFVSDGVVRSGTENVDRRDGLWGTAAVHYEVLSRPASQRIGRKEPAKPRTWAPEVVRPVKPYAYGYFGASESKSWYRQFGHQHSYVNYSRR